MTIAVCPKCRNRGAVGSRYCDCPAAMALRARDDADPLVVARRLALERCWREAEVPRLFVPEDGEDDDGN